MELFVKIARSQQKLLAAFEQVIATREVYNISSGESMAAATSKMELFVITVISISSCDNS